MWAAARDRRKQVDLELAGNSRGQVHLLGAETVAHTESYREDKNGPLKSTEIPYWKTQDIFFNRCDWNLFGACRFVGVRSVQQTGTSGIRTARSCSDFGSTDKRPHLQRVDWHHGWNGECRYKGASHWLPAETELQRRFFREERGIV